ncbi:MAG: ParA family protein, partial [Halomonadaceae bacterium]
SYTIIPTMYDRRTQASSQCLIRLRREQGDELWRYAIPVDTKFRDASQAGQVPSSLAPSSQGVRAYRRLLDDLVSQTRHDVPLEPQSAARSTG